MFDTPCRAISGVTTHALPGNFGLLWLLALDRGLRRDREPYRLLVQYVPHMYGFKGMNLLFVQWLKWMRPRAPWVMFHEVAFSLEKGQPGRHNFLAHVQQMMARWVARGMERGFVSIPAWDDYLNRLAPGKIGCEWLPVPSNISTRVAKDRVQALRAKLLITNTTQIVAHFGTFRRDIADELIHTLSLALKRNPNWIALFTGRNSSEFASRFGGENPELKNRVLATGGLDAPAVAEYLSAADVVYQPYPDGISSRRGSAMASLALGMPIVTHAGPMTESVWREKGLVVFVEKGDTHGACSALAKWMQRGSERDELMHRAREGYAAHFGWPATIDRLRH